MTKITKLEEHLREMQIHSPSISDEVAAERERLQEERESTEQCLAICAEDLKHIGQLQSSLSKEFSRDIISIPGGLMSSKQATTNALQEYKDILTNVTVDLEEHIREIKLWWRVGDRVNGLEDNHETLKGVMDREGSEVLEGSIRKSKMRWLEACFILNRSREDRQQSK
jgi:hypothetical protein